MASKTVAHAERRPAAPVLRLVPRVAPSVLTPHGQDAAELLETLLRHVRSGVVDGVAVVAFNGNGTGYLVDAAGRAYADPILARGVLAMLSDQLGKLARDKD